jgi:hypothetical protein
MKYLQNGGYHNNPFMKLTLSLSLVFLVGFVVTNFFLYFDRMDLTPQSVVSYYNGSEEDFHPARSYQSMLEVTHMHLPMMALVLLLLTHLVIFVPLSRGAKISLIVTPFLAGLFGEASSWLVRFVHPGFAWLKIVSFLTLQGSLLVLLGILAVFLLRSRRNDRGTDEQNKEDSPEEKSRSGRNLQERYYRTITRPVHEPVHSG